MLKSRCWQDQVLVPAGGSRGDSVSVLFQLPEASYAPGLRAHLLPPQSQQRSIFESLSLSLCPCGHTPCSLTPPGSLPQGPLWLHQAHRTNPGLISSSHDPSGDHVCKVPFTRQANGHGFQGLGRGHLWRRLIEPLRAQSDNNCYFTEHPFWGTTLIASVSGDLIMK